MKEDTEFYNGRRFPKFYFDDEPGQAERYTSGVDPYIEGDKSRCDIYYLDKEGRKCGWSVGEPEYEFVDCRRFKTKIKHLLAYIKHKLYNICGNLITYIR